MSRLSTEGTKLAPMPWMPVRPGLPPASTGERAGSTATTRIFGSCCLSTSPTPVMVPPVPTPATKASTWPSVAFRISWAVVRRWISGLAKFRNCCGMKNRGFSRSSSSAANTAPVIPSTAGVRTSSAPNRCSRARRSTLMSSGMVRINRYPLTAATIARPIPVLPEVGSTTVSPGFSRPSRSASSIMARAMRSLTLPPGFTDSSFPRTMAHPDLTSRRSGTSGVSPMSSSALDTNRAMLMSPQAWVRACPVARLPARPIAAPPSPRGSDLVGDPLFGLRPDPVADIRQRRVIHNSRDGVPHLGPDIAECAGGLLGTMLPEVLLGHAEDGCDGSVHRPEDLAQGNLSRRLGHVIPPVHASLARQDAGPLQGQEQLLQVPGWQHLSLRDGLNGNRAFIVMQGKVL